MKDLRVVKGVSLLLISFSLMGCASFGKKLKAFLGGKPLQETAQEAPKPKMTTYNDNPHYLNTPRRQYKRMTKQSLEDESQLNDRAGSLWTMEGQGAYLFSQNIVRMIGDPIGVKIDGEPKEQLQTKVDVIRKLLMKLEERQQARLRKPAQEKEEGEEGEDGEKKQAAASPPPPPKPQELPEFNVKTVPTRIVERMIDGNYRVKGYQPFMIGPREYKVIVTGIVRAEDFNEEGISSTKLLDPKFDIVSARRKDAEI